MVPAVSAAASNAAEMRAGDPSASRRAMFRRLWGYLAQNRRRYVLGTLLLLGYDAGFVIVPLLVGWSIQAVADGLPVAEVGRRTAILALVTLAEDDPALPLADQPSSTPPGRSSTRCATISSPTSSGCPSPSTSAGGPAT